MAIGWLAVLKSVPWTDVVSNAPMIADQAKKLWNVIAKKSPSSGAEELVDLPLSTEAQSMASLQEKLAVLEVASSKLHDQMLTSSELIKALAEQNTQLIKRIELNRVRVLWLTSAIVFIGIIVAFDLALTFSH